jgi:hypothetical protein
MGLLENSFESKARAKESLGESATFERHIANTLKEARETDLRNRIGREQDEKEKEKIRSEKREERIHNEISRETEREHDEYWELRAIHRS